MFSIDNFIETHHSLDPGIGGDFYKNIVYSGHYHHAYNCHKQLESIRKLKLPDIKTVSSKRAIIIENRSLPYLEYLVRKTIYMLGPEWGHTFVCCNSNTDIAETIASIHRSIQVINLGDMYLNQNTYNNLLLSKHFWNEIPSEKILIYQSDADICHGDIDRFLIYDYIGAPWPAHQNDNIMNVGNGGFSLRTKSVMIHALENHPIDNFEPNSSTINYMNALKSSGKPLDNPPEDVYFAKTMLDNNLGKVASPEVAKSFSNETSHRSTALGCHQPWLFSRSVLYDNELLKTYNLYTTKFSKGDATQHAGGWPSVIKHCEQFGVINNNGKIKLIDFTEQHFMWDNSPVINSPWTGIVHFAPEYPDYLNCLDIHHLLTNKNFQNSLNHCECLITLSEYLKQYLQDNAEKYGLQDVKIVNTYHPVTEPKSDKLFDITSIYDNKNLKVVQVGQQLRYMTTIFKICSKHPRLWLTGWRDMEKIYDMLYREIEWLNDETCTINVSDVDIKYLESDDEYYETLTTNIIVLNLIDASANNTIVELMIRNVPFFVNRLPAVEEYLGASYPLYFDNISQLNSILNNDIVLYKLLESGWKYLKQLSKYKIHHLSFASDLLKFANEN